MSGSIGWRSSNSADLASTDVLDVDTRSPGRPRGSGRLFTSSVELHTYLSNVMRDILSLLSSGRKAQWLRLAHSPSLRARQLRRERVARWIVLHSDELRPAWPTCTAEALHGQCHRLGIDYTALQRQALAAVPVPTDRYPCRDCNAIFRVRVHHCMRCPAEKPAHIVLRARTCGACKERDRQVR